MTTRLQVQRSRLFLLLALAICFSSCIKAQTKINPNQIQSPWTAPLSINAGNTGNVAAKYAAANAYYYVSGTGSDSNDGLSPGTAFATPQKCNTVVIALGGGTCDARTLYSYTTSTEIDCGNSSGVPVTCLLPNYGAWTVTTTGGTAYGLKIFSKSAALSNNTGQGSPFVIQAGATSNIDSVCGNDAATANYIRMDGFACWALSGAVVASAVLNIQTLQDESYVGHVSAATFSTTANKVFWVRNSCCSSTFEFISAEGSAIAGAVPCTIGSTADVSLLGPIFRSLSCVHPGSGQNAVARVQRANNISVQGLYLEAIAGADLTTAFIGVTLSASQQAADNFTDVTVGRDIASSTRSVFDLVAGTKMNIRHTVMGPVSTNFVNDHNTPGGLFTRAIGASADYSTDPTYFVAPTLIGVTNGTGLQFFNTTTTCTTGASVGANCTTAAITLPVAEADTAYRVNCTGKGPTNVPTVGWITNSSATQFTITIAALTAAAASFTSYDCVVGHN